MRWVLFTELKKEKRNSYTAMYNGVVSHGGKFGGIRVFSDKARVERNKLRLSSKRVDITRDPRQVRIYLRAVSDLQIFSYLHWCM